MGYKCRGSLVLLLWNNCLESPSLLPAETAKFSSKCHKPLQQPGKAKHIFKQATRQGKGPKSRSNVLHRELGKQARAESERSMFRSLPIPGTRSTPCSCDLQPPPCRASSSEPQTEPGPAAGTNPKLPKLLNRDA